MSFSLHSVSSNNSLQQLEIHTGKLRMQRPMSYLYVLLDLMVQNHHHNHPILCISCRRYNNHLFGCLLDYIFIDPLGSVISLVRINKFSGVQHCCNYLTDHLFHS